MKRIASVFITVSCTWISVSATIIHVPQQYLAIQDAINASIDGDTIEVSPGMYSGRVNFLGHRVLLTSESGPDSTIITTIPDSLPMIRFYTGEDSTTVLRGFTVRGGTGIAIGCLYSGPIIESNIIEDNTNHGHYSPNFDAAGIYARQSYCTIRNNTIRLNTSPGAGGGISISTSSGIRVIGNRIVSNTSGTGGGGIFMISSNDCLIKDNLITNNEGSLGGGGIWITEGGHNLLINNTIDSNFGPDGGGIKLLNSDYNFLDNNILTNNSPDYGIKKSWGIPFSDTVIYSDLFGNSPSDFDSVSLGIGCISGDPLYLDRANGDYSLTINSPCVDAGDPLSPVDPDGTRADMGAFPLYHRTLFHISPAGNDSVGFGSETSPFKTIQHGIIMAKNGDTVLVHEGHYYERINFRGKGIIVASQHLIDNDTLHIQNTIIDGDTLVLGKPDTGSVVCFVNGEDSTSILRGFTMQGGIGTFYSDYGFPYARVGGGIFLIGNGPTISDCIIVQNGNAGIFSAYGQPHLSKCKIINNNGDGFRSYSNSSPQIFFDSCYISSNSGPGIDGFGAGISLNSCDVSDNGGTGLLANHISLHNSIFARNSGDGVYIDRYFAGIQHEYYQIPITDTITNCTMDSNAVYGLDVHEWKIVLASNCIIRQNGAGGIQLIQEDSDLYMEDCMVADHYAVDGAAIYLPNNHNGIRFMHLERCVFKNNHAANYGGAIYGSMADSINIRNCLFIHNSAAIGGAIYSDVRRELITGCTFYQNSADSGAAIFINNNLYYQIPNLNNNIFYNNNSGVAISCSPNGPPNISCTDIFGNPGGDWVGCIDSFANINGNFSADPRFCDTTSEDFRIRSTSPCAPANNSCNALIGALGVGCYEISNFHLLSPLSDSVYNATPNPFIWSKSRETYLGQDASYRLYVSDDSTFSSADSSGILTDTTYSLQDSLIRSHRYYWKVKAFIDQAPPKFSMETGNFYLDGYPTALMPLSPANGSNTDSSSELIWLAGTDPDPFDSIRYSLQIDDSISFTSPIVNVTTVIPSIIRGDSLGVILNELPGFGSLQPNTTYHWRIRSNDKYGLSSVWSSKYFIFLAQISTFGLLSPDSGSVQISSQPILAWHHANHIDSSVSIIYRAYLSTNPSLSSPDSSGNLADTSFSFAVTLNRSTKYFWRVQAFGEGATSRYSDQIWSFYIDGYPTIPTIIYPQDGAIVDTLTYLTWIMSTDPDSLDTINYNIQIDDDSLYLSPEVNDTILSPISLDQALAVRINELDGYTSLHEDSVYYWRIRSDDNFGLNSAWTSGRNNFIFMPHMPAPHLEITPLSFADTILLGSQIVDTLKIRNLGDAALLISLNAVDSISIPLSQNGRSLEDKNDDEIPKDNIVKLDNIWLFVSPASDSLAPGDSLISLVTINTANINAGGYNGSIVVHSNDPIDSLAMVQVALVVTESGCHYIPGDINGNGTSNGIDVVFGVNYFKGSGTAPPVDCHPTCPNEPNPFYAAGDVNGNCAYNGIDITFFVRYLKGEVPSLLYCPDCPWLSR
jgi:parallel beta-helix repeat protein/predicted outer membrane repeat protein